MRQTLATLLGFLFSVFACQFLFSQESQMPTPDTLVKKKTLELSEISRKSAELTMKAKMLVKKMITDEELEELGRYNDSLVNMFDSLLKVSNVNISTLSNRNLKGKLTYWELNLQTLSSQESRLASEFDELDETRKTLKKELKLWEETDRSIQGEKLAEAVHKRFVQVEAMIDTTLRKVDLKGARILLLMDRLSNAEIAIESFISSLKTTISNNQEDLFSADEPTFFDQQFGNLENWRLSKSMIQYYSGNFNYLLSYLKKFYITLIFHFLGVVILIFIFIRISRSSIHGGTETGGTYKKRLKLILSKPVSAALIVGIFANALIYSFQPLWFMDLFRLLLVFPIVILLNAILPKKYRIYVYLFGLMVILLVIYINLPTDHIVSRLLLLFIALVEAGSIIHYLMNYSRKHQHGQSSRVIFFLSYVLLIISVISIFGNLTGRVMLATLMAQAVLGFLLAGIIISLALIVVNGLWVLFVDSHYSKSLKIVYKNKDLAKRKVTGLFNFLALILLIYFMLQSLNIETFVVDWINEFLEQERHIGSIEFTWGQVFLFFLVIWLSTVIANLIRALLEADVLSRIKLDKGLPNTIAMLVKYSLVTLGVFIAVSAIGLPLDSLTVILGAFGVGIGFGLQNIFNNLVSGLILLFERPIKINDTVEVGTLIGNVRSIGIRASNVRTFDGAEIIVPNGNLISNEVINWTLSDQKRRIEVIIGVSYGSDPHQVHDVLMDVVKSHEDVIDDPEPLVLFNDLGESSLDFRCLFWTFNFSRWIIIRSEIIFAAFDALKEAGIEIPFPQRDLHLRSMDKNIEFKTVGEPKRVAKNPKPITKKGSSEDS